MSVIDRLFGESELLASLDGEEYRLVTAVYRQHPVKGIMPYCSSDEWDSTAVAKLAKSEKELRDLKEFYEAEIRRLESERDSLKSERIEIGEVPEPEVIHAAPTLEDLTVEDLRPSTRMPTGIKRASKVVPKKTNGHLRQAHGGDSKIGVTKFCKICGKGPYTPRGLSSHETWHKHPERTMSDGRVRKYKG